MNELEATQKIKESHPTISILIQTVYNEVQAQQYRPDECITKPILTSGLIEKVNFVLKKKN